MESKKVELDPYGDVDIVLRSQNTQELRWDTSEVYTQRLPEIESREPVTLRKRKKPRRTDPQSGEPVLNPEPVGNSSHVADPGFAASPLTLTEHDETGSASLVLLGRHHPETFVPIPEGESDEIWIRASSRHLCLASSIFRKRLAQDWTRGLDKVTGTQKILEVGWDVDALLIVLRIIHGQHQAVPRSVSLERLAKIAVLVDYYDCHEPVEVFTDLWLADLMGKLPSSYGKESTLWWSISWVLSRMDVFEKMTELARMECRGPIDMELPLPEKLLITIETRRIEAVEQMLTLLDDLRKALCEESSCSFACSAMLLGSLLRNMHQAGLNNLRDKRPFLGCSISWLHNTISDFWTPAFWPKCSLCSSSSSNPHLCDLKDRIKPALADIMQTTRDVGLKDIMRQREHSSSQVKHKLRR